MKAGILASVNGNPECLKSSVDALLEKGVDSLFLMGNILSRPGIAGFSRDSKAPLSREYSGIVSEGSLRCIELVDGYYDHFRSLETTDGERGCLFYFKGRNELETIDQCEQSRNPVDLEVYRKLMFEYGQTSLDVKVGDSAYFFMVNPNISIERLTRDEVPYILKPSRRGKTSVYFVNAANHGAFEVEGSDIRDMTAGNTSIKAGRSYVVSPGPAESGRVIFDGRSIDLFGILPRTS